MIKAGFDFDFGLIVAVITIAFAGINAIISKNNKKKKDDSTRDAHDENVIEQNSAKSDLDELKEMFGFSSVIDSLINEPNVEEPEEHIKEEVNRKIDIKEDNNEIDFQDEIKQHFKNVSYESVEVPVQEEFIIDRIEDEGTLQIEEKFAETDVKEIEKNLTLKQMLKENPKMLIFCSEILKPKYQDF